MMDEKTVFLLLEKMTFSELLEDFDPFEADLEQKAAEKEVTVDYYIYEFIWLWLILYILTLSTKTLKI